MILKNKTKYLLMAGMPGILTTPLYAQQIYMCKPCPANTYSNGKECVPCGEFQYSDIGSAQCTDLKYEIEYTVAEFNEGGKQINGTLPPGFYAIILGGGNGGAPSFNGGAYYYLKSGIRAGYGAQLQYVIRVDENTKYTLASGANGVGAGNASAATGGGGGSWAKIGDTYYVAGGGGGAVTGANDSDNHVSSQGGYGGGTGAGGGGGDDYEGSRGTYGGNSGNYGGGFGDHSDGRGGTGGGENNGGGLGGAQDKYDNCGGNRFTQPNTNPYGGIGGLFSMGKCFGDQTSTTGYYTSCSSGYASSCNCYRTTCSTSSKTFWVRNGGDGKTSHTSNTDKFTSKLCRTCAKIFKIK